MSEWVSEYNVINVCVCVMNECEWVSMIVAGFFMKIEYKHCSMYMGFVVAISLVTTNQVYVVHQWLFVCNWYGTPPGSSQVSSSVQGVSVCVCVLRGYKVYIYL